MHIIINRQYYSNNSPKLTTTLPMQFSQLTQLQSFKENIPANDAPFEFKIQQTPHIQVQPVQPSDQFYTILDQIQEINQSRSAYFSLIDDKDRGCVDLMPILEHHHNNMDIEQQDQQQEILPYSTPARLVPKMQHRKSNMFTPTHSADERRSTQGTDKIQRNNTIQMYYFGQPVYKYIEYTESTNIDALISKALALYIKDLSLDQTFIVTTDYKKYDLRFPKDQGGCKPDYTLQAISRDRVIADSLFQVLILVVKEKTAKETSQSLRVSKNALSDSIQLGSLNQLKLNIMNEANMIVASVILNKDDVLLKALNYLQGEFKQKIILTESIQDDTPLPEDMEVRNLSTYRLYVKKRKYLDQPQKQKLPLKIISSIPKDLSPKSLPPIGINEASRYEQFQVIKINSRGVEQPRILGIDQTKVYNYDVSVRKSGKQASFLSKIIGNSPITGTKKPERLISEIVQVTPLSGFNFQIIFPEKRILYITDSQEKKFKILRKLKFLIEYNNQNKKN